MYFPKVIFIINEDILFQYIFYLHSSSYHLDAFADNSSTQDSKDINVC